MKILLDRGYTLLVEDNNKHYLVDLSNKKVIEGNVNSFLKFGYFEEHVYTDEIYKEVQAVFSTYKCMREGNL